LKLLLVLLAGCGAPPTERFSGDGVVIHAAFQINLVGHEP
jgi:hypothetical protein